MSTWKFGRMKGFEERAAILKQPIADHDGYYRDNNGDWIVGDGEGRVASVRFCGTAKRGQGYNAPDPEGMRRARLIAAAPQMLEALKEIMQLSTLNLQKVRRDYERNRFIIEKVTAAAIKLAEGE